MINKMIDNENYIGTFIIKHKSGGEDVIYNRVTNNFLDALINSLDGINPDLQIKYLAIGTSNTPITDNPTQLGNEIFRTQFITSDKTGTGEFTTTFTILGDDAIGTWQELGIFAGSTALPHPNKDTGILVSRVLYFLEKTALDELDITRVDKIQRG